MLDDFWYISHESLHLTGYLYVAKFLNAPCCAGYRRIGYLHCYTHTYYHPVQWLHFNLKLCCCYRHAGRIWTARFSSKNFTADATNQDFFILCSFPSLPSKKDQVGWFPFFLLTWNDIALNVRMYVNSHSFTQCQRNLLGEKFVHLFLKNE